VRILSLALLAACAPTIDVSLPASETAKSFVVAAFDPVGEALSIRIFDTSALPNELPLMESEGLELRVLLYDQTVAELDLRPDGDGELERMPPAASPEIAWPLPQPAEAYVLDASTFVSVGNSDWRETARVRRPPCAHSPVSRGIDWGDHYRDASFAVPLGAHLLIGIPANYRATPSTLAELVLLEEGTETIVPVQNPLPFNAPVYPPNNAPRCFSEGDRAWVFWPVWTGTVTRYEIHSVSADGVVGTATVTHHPQDFEINDVQGRRHDGKLTVLARTPKGQRFSYDEVTHRWTLVGESPAEEECQGGGRGAFVLEIDGPGRGLFSRQRGDIGRFDLAQPGESKLVANTDVFDGARFCASTHATLETGREIYVVRTSMPGSLELVVYELAERPRDGVWQRATTAIASAHVAIPFGELLFTSASGDTSMVALEGAATRPDLPLRKCGDEIPVRLTPSVGVRWGERIFVGGLAGGAVIDP